MDWGKRGRKWWNISEKNSELLEAAKHGLAHAESNAH
jgi:hypothetical protein